MADISSSSEAYSSSDSIAGSEENVTIGSHTGDDIVEEDGDKINGEDSSHHHLHEGDVLQESATESLPDQERPQHDSDIVDNDDDGQHEQETLQDVDDKVKTDEKNDDDVHNHHNQAAYVSYTVDDSGKGNDDNM